MVLFDFCDFFLAVLSRRSGWPREVVPPIAQSNGRIWILNRIYSLGGRHFDATPIQTESKQPMEIWPNRTSLCHGYQNQASCSRTVSCIIHRADDEAPLVEIHSSSSFQLPEDSPIVRLKRLLCRESQVRAHA